MKLDNAFVYCWTDHKTNRLYIGTHKGMIDDGYVCSSKLMMEQYNQRPEDFTRQIIAEGNNYVDMLTLEQKILESVDAKRNPEYYNMHNGNGKFFVKEHTKETKLKISFSKKGKSRTEDTKRKLSEFRKGRTHSEETKQRMSNSHKGNASRVGKDISPDHRQKISQANKGNTNWLGKNHSNESKQKMSEAHKGKIISEEQKLKISISRKGKKHTEKAKHRVSEANKGNTYRLGTKHTEETRQKMVASHAARKNRLYNVT